MPDKYCETADVDITDNWISSLRELWAQRSDWFGLKKERKEKLPKEYRKLFQKF
jgi:hypothetical protein